MASTRRTDAELISLVLAGQGELFHAIVDRHSAPLWTALGRFLANREDAREVFQETWLRAYERLDSLREPNRLRSWLLSIALNLCRQRLRRPQPETLDAAEAVSEELPVGRALEREELLGRMRAEIARLPARQRQVVELRVHQDLSHAEIAELLGISAENARANLYQGLRHLRSAICPLVNPGEER